MMPLNMTGYRSVRKPALDAPQQVELEVARDRAFCAVKPAEQVIPIAVHTYLHFHEKATITLPGNSQLHSVERRTVIRHDLALEAFARRGSDRATRRADCDVEALRFAI
jgi:hypothetical protein